VLAVTFALEPGAQSMPVRYAELADKLGLQIGSTAPLQAVRSAVLELRRAKGMVLDPQDPDTVSAGSFFLNPILDPTSFSRLQRRLRERGTPEPPAFPQPDDAIKTSAAWLIQQAGFRRGYGNPNGIAISSKHTLALTNRGGGTTRELVALAQEIAGAVQREFGVVLTPEPVFVGVAWEPLPAKVGQGF
jgi:UDP-N-acetylmuramate dehydrogenase